MLSKTLIRKALAGILFAGFDDKWGGRAKQVYEKNKNSEIWKKIAGDDDIITMDELKQWLAQQGLESDGKIGKKTLRKLGFNSNHAWIPRDINRPQLVYTSRLDIPEEELKTKHPEKWKQVKHDRALAALVPIKVANNINLISNKDTDKYAYGEDQRGDAVLVNLSQYERNQNKIKGLKDTLQGMINSGLSTESPEYQEVYNKLLDLEENKFDHINTVMDEVVVRANPIYAADKGENGSLVAREGWIPVETSEGHPYAGRVFKKTSGPDQWYITNGRGWIMGTSNDSRVLTDDYKDATTAMWDTQRKDALLHDAYMQAYDDVANTEIAQRVNNNWNPNTGLYGISTLGVDGTPVLISGVSLPYEQIQQRSWTPQYDGTETVTYNPELQRRLETGRYAESNFDIIPTDENTVGGNFNWNGTNGRTIIAMPGTGKGKRKTEKKPSKN